MAKNFAAVVVFCTFCLCSHGQQLSVTNTYAPGDTVKVTITLEHPLAIKNGFLRFQLQTDSASQFGIGTTGGNDNTFEKHSDTEYVIGQKVPDVASGAYQLVLIDADASTGFRHEYQMQRDFQTVTVQVNNPNKPLFPPLKGVSVDQKK